MPTAIYLYNSQETASVSFFNQLRVKLEAAGWTAKADFTSAVSGREGAAMAEVITEMGKADAIVYAVGPKGPGNTQATVEAPAALEARIAAARKQRDLKLVPVLVAGAEVSKVPEVLRFLSVQMNNTAREGEDELAGTLRALLGDAQADAVLKGAPPAAGARLTSDVKLQQVVSKIARNGDNGLAVFVGPYAVSEVHEGMGPGDIGHELLKQKLPFLESDDLLAHPFVAAAAKAMLEYGSFQATWQTIQRLFQEKAAEPLELHRAMADLAAVWETAKPAAEATPRYKGLLFITTDLDMRLERALWEANVAFGRLRMSRPDEGEPGSEAEANVRAIYERPNAHAVGRTLQFTRISATEQGAGNVESSAAIEARLAYEPVMVVKLLDCVSNDVCPPLATIQFLMAVRQARLPSAVAGLLQRAPFLMLGGGLLHPLVSFALATHFLPNFVPTWAGSQPVPRYVAIHAARRPGDKLRQLEEEADRNEINWTDDLFALERLNCDLPYFLRQLGDAIAAAARPVALSP